MRYLAAIGVFFAASLAAAGDNGVHVIRSRVPDQQQVTYNIGLSTVIGEDDTSYYLLTCAHVVIPEAGAAIWSTEVGGRWVLATVLRHDKSHDLCLLSVGKGDNALTVWPINAAPSRGPAQTITLDREWYTTEYDPRPADQSRFADSGVPCGMTTHAAMSGDSGAPVIAGGKLVGIVWGSSGRTMQYRQQCMPGQQCYVPSNRVNAPAQQALQEPRRYVRPPGRSECVPSYVIHNWLIDTRGAIPAPSGSSAPASAAPTRSQPSRTEQCEPCQAAFADILLRLQALERQPLQRGPAGPKGDTGEQGPKGDPAVLTQAMLDAAIERYFQAHPQQVRIIIEDSGKLVFDRSGVPVGSVVRVPIQRVSNAP